MSVASKSNKNMSRSCQSCGWKVAEKTYNESQSQTLCRSSGSETPGKFLTILNDKLKSNLLLFDINRRVVIRVNKKEFNEKEGVVITIKDCKIKLLNGNKTSFMDYRYLFGSKIRLTSESIFSIFSNVAKTGSHLARLTYKIATQESTVQTNALLLDATSLILQHSAGTFNNWTPTYFLGFIARIYSIFIRTKDLFCDTPNMRSESLDGMILLTSALGLPDQVFKILKNLNLMTSKKIGDHPGLFLDFIQQISTYFLNLVTKLTWLPDNVINFLKIVFTFGTFQTLLYEMRETLSLWNKDKRVMISQEFRNRISLLKNKIDEHPDTVEKIRTNLKHKEDYSSFERMVKGAKAYESCSRQEPVFIVLEGPPGVKKTIAMLQLIKLLGRSTYSHIIKGTEDGKDHYDGYNNEEVFAMDDVGQQSVSQWRTVINMVSSMKMPLECAALDLKDTKYFDSKFLLVTTNQFSQIHGLTKTDGIADIKALWRRAHVISFTDSSNAHYKRFDVYEDKWTNQIIGNVPLINKVTGSTTHIACWITALAEKLEEYYLGVLESIELTSSQIQNCRDRIDDFKTEFHDTKTHFEQEVLDTMSLIVSKTSSIIKENFNILLDLIVDNLNFANCMYSTVASLCCYGIYYGISSLFEANGEETLEGNENLLILQDWKNKVKGKNMKITLTATGILVSEGQAGTCVNAASKQVKIVKILTNDNTYEVSHCFVTGTYIVLPAHVIFNSKNKLILYNSQQEFLDEKRALDCCKYEVLLEDKLNDVAVLQLPLLNLSPYKDFSHLFKYRASVAKKMYFVWSGEPVPLDGIIKPFLSNPRYLTKFGYVDPVNVISYEMASKGFCGSLIVDENVGILGFHVAGDGLQTGIAKIFSQSTLAKIYSLISVKYNYKDVVINEIKDEGSFSGMIGDSKKVSDGPKQTHLTPSQLYDFYPETKSPANLRSLGEKTVKIRAKRVHKIVTPIPAEELNFMEEFLMCIIPNFGPITEYEVIKGNKELASINKDSVSGMDFPLDKRNYFDFDKGTCSDAMIEALETYRNQCQLEYPEKITQHHTLKDELRLKHKVDKPRTFGVDSLTTQFEMKRLMGSLFVKLKEQRWINYLAIGINPYADWQEVFDKMNDCKLVWDGDIGEYDASVSPEIQDVLNKVVLKKFIGEKYDLKVLERVLELSIRSWVIAGNKIMFKTHGILSGMWITNLFNSLINRCYSAGWYYRMHKQKYSSGTNSTIKTKQPSVAEFLDIIVDFVQGDDKLNGVRKDEDIYNALTMRDYYVSCGMTFTDGEKGEITSPGKDIEDCVFLKRKFKYHEQLGHIVGPLSKETLTNTMRWFSNDSDEQTVMQDKLLMFQREMFLHGKEGRLAVDQLENYCKTAGIKFVRVPDNYLRYAFEITPDYLYQQTKNILNKQF